MTPPDEDGFQILGRQRVHDGFVKLDVYQVAQTLFQGGSTPPLTREIVTPRPAVAVLCYDPVLDVVVLVQQRRLAALLAGFEAMQTEIVAGLVDPGETPEEVARREVHEESGLAVIGELVPIAHLASSPGFSTEAVHLFCARVDAAAATEYHGLATEHEDIRLCLAPFEDFVTKLETGGIVNAFALVAGYWMINRRAALRAQWLAADLGGTL
jgi:ADP-ribose pyrophosphatase